MQAQVCWQCGSMLQAGTTVCPVCGVQQRQATGAPLDMHGGYPGYATPASGPQIGQLAPQPLPVAQSAPAYAGYGSAPSSSVAPSGSSAPGANSKPSAPRGASRITSMYALGNAFVGTPASVGTRVLSLVIDLAVIAVAGVGAWLLSSSWLLGVIVGVEVAIIFMVMQAHMGASLGKLLTRTRVSRVDEPQSPGLVRSGVRSAITGVGALFAAIGAIAVELTAAGDSTGKRRTIADRAARTVVVSIPSEQARIEAEEVAQEAAQSEYLATLSSADVGVELTAEESGSTGSRRPATTEQPEPLAAYLPQQSSARAAQSLSPATSLTPATSLAPTPSVEPTPGIAPASPVVPVEASQAPVAPVAAPQPETVVPQPAAAPAQPGVAPAQPGTVVPQPSTAVAAAEEAPPGPRRTPAAEDAAAPGPRRTPATPEMPAPPEPNGDLRQRTRRASYVEGSDAPPAPTSGGTVLTFDSGQREVVAAFGSAVLGRAPSASAAQMIVVNDTSTTISKNHARWEQDRTGFWVTDLGSTNGTELIYADGRTQVLTPGVRTSADGVLRIRLGDRTFTMSPLSGGSA